jgi:class 3 adenylate cyclase
MDELLNTLEANEPTISAIVGLLTIGAAVWGVVQLAVYPLLTANRSSSGRDADPLVAEPVFHLWPSLVNRGVDPRADFIEQISRRTLNVCLITMVSAAFALLVLSLSVDNVGLGIVNLFVFLACIVAYNLHAADHPEAARWVFIVAVILHWNLNILLMGTRVGLEYCLGGVLLLPLLLFEKHQTRQMYIASALAIVSLPIAIALEGRVADSWPFNAVVPPTHYYHVNSVILALLVFLVLIFYNRSADASFKLLEDREQKSAELIHALLPAYIAQKMPERGNKVADWHSEASVLFATVIGFDQLYKRVSAVQLVELLREVFEEFDELVEAHGVEKINTLGTNYVAATGIDPDREASTEQLARVAIAMRDVVERLSRAVDHPFGLRVGISTGDVVSGVIGDERPSFDIWGRTVELANAMRDDAANNTIVVGEATYWRLKQAFRFDKQTGHEGVFLLLDEL